MVLLFVWIIFCLIVGAIGDSRTVGFWGAFLWSFLLSPLIGLIITLSSKSKTQAAIEVGLLNQLSAPKKQSLEDELTIRLQKIQDMKDKKLITEEEYKSLRNQILASKE
jgi:hypothetical protein